mgnify:CR=1 FL=1
MDQVISGWALGLQKEELVSDLYRLSGALQADEKTMRMLW